VRCEILFSVVSVPERAKRYLFTAGEVKENAPEKPVTPIIPSNR
jgi:hypothetical protein